MTSVRKNNLMHVVAVYSAVLPVLAAGGYFLLSEKKTVHKTDQIISSGKSFSDLAYYDLPRITVSMNMNKEGLPPRIRADIALEVARKDMKYVANYQPHIMDKISGFMENIRPEDLDLSGSTTQLRTDLLRAINDSGSPILVHGLLFRQLVVL